jgi:sulfatase maturation enzyme AslB (radical SAM superfamily)
MEELLEAKYFVRVNVTGSGDPFASPLYLDFLKNLKYYPRLSLELQTNGVLMDEAHFPADAMRITNKIQITVDAASRETYEKIRVGGSFERLKKNITWLDHIRARGLLPKLRYIDVAMVVQKGNYREMATFVDWMKQYPSVDRIFFSKILDWGHLSAPAFSDKAVWMQAHPEHQLFLESLRNPSLRDGKVDLGNLSSYLPSSFAL